VGRTYDPDETRPRQVTFGLRIVGDRHPARVTTAVVEFIESIGGEAPRRFGSEAQANPFPTSGD
jgi:hypothetical protein